MLRSFFKSLALVSLLLGLLGAGCPVGPVYAEEKPVKVQIKEDAKEIHENGKSFARTLGGHFKAFGKAIGRAFKGAHQEVKKDLQKEDSGK